MGVGLGTESYLQIKKETAWGTDANTGMLKILFSSEDLRLDMSKFDAENIVAGAAPEVSLPGPKSVVGSIRGQATYNGGFEQLVYGVLGTQTVSTPTTGTNTRDKWYEPSTLLPSWSIHENAGDLPDDDVYQWVGCKVNRLSISIPDQGPVTYEAQILGKDDAAADPGEPGATGTEDASGYQHILAHGPSSASHTLMPTTTGISTFCVKSLNIVIDRGMKLSFCSGSSTPSEPQPEDFLRVTGEYVIETHASVKQFYQSFRAFTDVVASSGTNYNRYLAQGTVIELALRYAIEVKLNRLRWLAPSKPYVDRRGKLHARLPFEAYGNAGTAAPTTADAVSWKQPIAIRFRNKLVAANF